MSFKAALFVILVTSFTWLGVAEASWLKGLCDRGLEAIGKAQLALDSPVYSRSKDGDMMITYTDKRSGETKHISLREAFDNESLLAFVSKNPVLVKYWKILALVGHDLEWEEVQGENNGLITAQGTTILGRTLIKIADKKTAEGIQIDIIHENQAKADYFQSQIKIASDRTKQDYPEFKVGYQKGTAKVESETLPGTSLLIFNRFGYQANGDFFHKLFEAGIFSP